jgi:flagellar biosynthesis protein FlhF
MKIRRFFGKDMREALKLVKEELGQDAVIMSNRKVSDGVELVAAYDKEPEPVLKPTPQPVASTSVNTETKKTVPTLSEIIGDDGPDNLKALLAQQAKVQQEQAQQSTAQVQTVTNSNPPAAPISQHKSESDFMAEFETTPNVTNSESDASSLGSIKEEIATLRHLLQHQVADLMDAKKQRQKPIHGFIHKQLLGLGLSYNLANQFAGGCLDGPHWYG